MIGRQKRAVYENVPISPVTLTIAGASALLVILFFIGGAQTKAAAVAGVLGMILARGQAAYRFHMRDKVSHDG